MRSRTSVRFRSFSTTWLASVSVLALTLGDAAAAEPISVRIEGEVQQWVTISNPDVDTGDGTNIDTSWVDQKHNSEIQFVGETNLDNGLTVGFTVELEANTDSENQIDQSFLFVEKEDIGLLQLGDTDNAPVNMAVTAPTGGVSVNDGDLFGIEAFVIPEGFNGTNTLIDTTVLQLGDDSSGKINYFSPRFAGLQLGVSYIPQFEEGGDNNSMITRVGNDGPVQNGFTAALNYTQNFGDTAGVQAYAGYLWGDTPSSAGSSNVQGAGGGIQLAIAGFEVGGSYAWANGDTPGDTSIDGQSYDFGVAYEIGPYRVGATYIKGTSEGQRGDGERQHLDQGVISGTYTMGPGVDLVGGLYYVDADGEHVVVQGTDGILRSSGLGFASGLKLTF